MFSLVLFQGKEAGLKMAEIVSARDALVCKKTRQMYDNMLREGWSPSSAPGNPQGGGNWHEHVRRDRGRTGTPVGAMMAEQILTPKVLFVFLPLLAFFVGAFKDTAKSVKEEREREEEEGGTMVEAYKGGDGKWKRLAPGVEGYGEKRMRLEMVRASDVEGG